jgi:hypothetical protein
MFRREGMKGDATKRGDSKGNWKETTREERYSCSQEWKGFIPEDREGRKKSCIFSLYARIDPI